MEHHSCPHPSYNDSEEEHIPLAAQTKMRDDDDENSHLEEVCNSFRQYATFARRDRLGRAQRFLSTLKPLHQQFIPPSLTPVTLESAKREEEFQRAEIQNQFFFDSMLHHAGMPNSQDVRHHGAGRSNDAPKRKKGKRMWSSDDNMSKVSSVLKSLVRDWSEEGATERNQSYRPILNGVEKYMPLQRRDRGRDYTPRIVVPGAGVGRLALELYSKGYEVQGNEFSFHMLLASDFILNGGCSPTTRQFAISPWLTETKNVCCATDRTRSIYVPDVDPFAMMSNQNDTSSLEGHDTQQQQYKPPEFSMAAGEFLSIYKHPKEHGKWDAVASCFFLDTAPCIIDYIKTIYDMLKHGGILINFGPLLYHWSSPPMRPEDNSFEEYKDRNSNLDERYVTSVDMSWDDVREVMLRVGFVMEEEQIGIPARYTADRTSMLTTEYHCVYCVARKK